MCNQNNNPGFLLCHYHCQGRLDSQTVLNKLLPPLSFSGFILFSGHDAANGMTTSLPAIHQTPCSHLHIIVRAPAGKHKGPRVINSGELTQGMSPPSWFLNTWRCKYKWLAAMCELNIEKQKFLYAKYELWAHEKFTLFLSPVRKHLGV